MKRKVISLLVALCLMVGCLTVTGSAATIASGEGTDGQKWSLDSTGVLTYTGTGSMPIFPSPTRVYWREYADQIKAVRICEGITRIEDFNFLECQNLSVVIIPASVTYIDPWAFGDYPALSVVYYGGSKDAWNKIKFTDSYTEKNPILNATIYYNNIGKLFFLDVPSDAYYATPVAWAVENAITSGTGAATFSPDATCTRGQIVTFLWRAMGSPTVDTDVSFADIAPGAYYEEAVKWAVVNNVTAGTGDGSTFSPDAPCDRAQAVTFMWRANGKPAANGSSFSDVESGSYYEDAVKWAVSKNITSGTSSTTFSPNQSCARGQIVTFLYRGR